MNYLWRLIPVIIIVLALGGAIYHVLSEEPKPATPSSAQADAGAPHKSLVPPGYGKKSS
jgi:hypothetical protein